MGRERLKLKFDEVVMEVEADSKICDNLKFIYRNYLIYTCKSIDLYFRIDGTADAVLTNNDIIHIDYSYDGINFRKWKFEDTIFPPLQLEPLKGRYLVLHGCCVSKNERAFVILGKSMSGKTKTMLKLINEGYQLLSDDLVFIDKNNLVHVYKKPLGFRTLIADEYPDLYKKILSLREKLIFQSDYGFKTYLVHADDLFSEVYNNKLVKITKICILSNDNKIEETDIDSLKYIYDLEGLCCNSGIGFNDLISRLLNILSKIEVVKCNPETVIDHIE